MNEIRYCKKDGNVCVRGDYIGPYGSVGSYRWKCPEHGLILPKETISHPRYLDPESPKEIVENVIKATKSLVRKIRGKHFTLYSIHGTYRLAKKQAKRLREEESGLLVKHRGSGVYIRRK